MAEFKSRVKNRYTLFDKIFGRSPDNYFTFAFTRNPWDRMASLYLYLVEKRPRPEIDAVSTFKEFLVKANNRCEWIQSLSSMRPQVDYFTFPDGKKKIDFLGHFEYLNEDIKTVADRLDISLKLKHLNRSTNKKKDYRKYYDNEMAEIVGSIFKEDCRFFGYEFETPYPGNRISDGIDEMASGYLVKDTEQKRMEYQG